MWWGWQSCERALGHVHRSVVAVHWVWHEPDCHVITKGKVIWYAKWSEKLGEFEYRVGFVTWHFEFTLIFTAAVHLHWQAKPILCYLKGTRGWHLMLGGDQLEVSAYMDADWGNDCDNRCSIRAYIIKVGGGAVSWKSKKHVCVTLSSTEVEYVALCQAVKESVWMIEFLKTLGVLIHDAMMVNVDNQGAMALARNPVFHNWYPCSVPRHHWLSKVCISSLCIKHAVSYLIILCNTYIYCHIIWYLWAGSVTHQ